MVILHALILASMLALSHICMKSLAGSLDLGLKEFIWAEWHRVLISIGLYVSVFVYYVIVLKRVDLSILYPLYTVLSLVLVMVLSAYFFQERLTWSQLLGVVFASVGIFLIAGGANE